ncbi:hypothetical protein P3X46_025511 [Hevea brasiliensis]|uniref:Pectinesterase inhibitor domain-containing protein n=1 Tax=Hevea brasiliensis TaxID=3981 RepID=A0ABQ9L603_HEVBR|nr:pectinesterase inhibitor 7 [Hevea brasiliensis]KAJ9160077.1 hypothetical protein P3X46_025511 [Hevea brasiliensis]
MAKVAVFLLFLLLCMFFISGMAKPASSKREYIKALCKETPSPPLCVQYLSMFPNSTIQNPMKMANAALLASLYRAQYAKSYTLTVIKRRKLVKHPIVDDCLDQISSAVQELNDSITELHYLGGHAKKGSDDHQCDDDCHISNIATWLSAAETDSSTCVDELDEWLSRNKSNLLTLFRTRFRNVVDAIGNALALFCTFAAKCQ